jgi:hypothetical protein
MTTANLNGAKTVATVSPGRPRSEIGLLPDGIQLRLRDGPINPIVDQAFVETLTSPSQYTQP